MCWRPGGRDLNTPALPLLPPGAAAELRRFVAYWQALKGDAALPPRARMQPEDFPELLHTAFLLEAEGAGDFRVRLAGTFLYELYGREVTGLTVRQTVSDPAEAQALLAAYRRCLAECRPHYARREMTWRPTGAALLYERVVAPFADAAGRPRYLLGVGAFHTSAGLRFA